MFTHISSCKQLIIRCTKTSINRLYKRTQKIIVSYFNNKQIREEKWIKNGKLHRIYTYDDNGQKLYEAWHNKNGVKERIGAPAVICYFKSGQLRHNAWYKDGELHRPGGAPFFVVYFENGKINAKYASVEQFVRGKNI